jgi:DNA (cytosine-5)-methyltransferase 1
MNLWPDMLRIVREVEPRYVFAENVSRHAIESAAHDLTAMGYYTDLLALSAADLGADHIRQRYWLLAYTDDKRQLRRCIDAEMAQCTSVRKGLWETGPNYSRMAHGMAGRMERYSATGNGQVPLVAAAALWSLARAD